MIALIKSLWATTQSGDRRTSVRIGALIGMSALFSVPIVMLIALVRLAKFLASASSATRSVCVLGCLCVICCVGAAAKKVQLAKERQANEERLMADTIYRRIAIMLIPAISQVTSIDLEPEEVVYDLVGMPYGSGFYYSTPRLLTEQEMRKLRRLIVTKLYGRVQITRTDMVREGIVIVGGDHVFIRNDPRVVQYFSNNC